MDFDQICMQLKDWNDHLKAAALYQGLAHQIKVAIANQSSVCPRALLPLKELTLTFNENYWEYKSEQSNDSG